VQHQITNWIDGDTEFGGDLDVQRAVMHLAGNQNLIGRPKQLLIWMLVDNVKRGVGLPVSWLLPMK
jgi:hypothetical protein